MTNHDDLNNLGRGSPKKHSCQVIFFFLTNVFFYLDFRSINTNIGTKGFFLMEYYNCLFVLRFYGPVNLMGPSQPPGGHVF